MSTAKHTPGPWEIVPPSREHPSRAMVCARLGVTIYDVPLCLETRANARLIAAAPDLLAKCKIAEDICRTVFSLACADMHREYDKRLLQALLLDLDDVIAKATGKGVPL